MSDWITLKWSDLPPPEPYKMRPHKPVKLAFLPWSVCQGCGLIYVRNALTAWAVAKGCDFSVHPEYKRAVKQLGRAEANR